MTILRPGCDGDTLPANTLVFRIGRKAELSPEALEKKRAMEVMFKPSSLEEQSLGQRLSVWVEELTLPDQAWAFMGCNPEKTVVACLGVDAIRAIQPPESFRSLDVEWEKALNQDGTVNELPGADGHVGITGLLQGGNGKTDRNRRKTLRSKLADLASISPVPVPHDIPEENIRVAAYFIYQNLLGRSSSPDLDWIEAIRRMRRIRVRQYRLQNSPC